MYIIFTDYILNQYIRTIRIFKNVLFVLKIKTIILKSSRASIHYVTRVLQNGVRRVYHHILELHVQCVESI